MWDTDREQTLITFHTLTPVLGFYINASAIFTFVGFGYTPFVLMETFTIYLYVQYDWWLDPGHVTLPSGGTPQVDFGGVTDWYQSHLTNQSRLFYRCVCRSIK